LRREALTGMVDFKKLRAAKSQPEVTEPTEIFRRLPKPPGINDLYTSQAQVLEEWYGRRDEQDLVIKLHTGGGKTLVGLLIAQSALNETREPVIYLSPTVQLVQQTLEKAAEYGIPAVPYEKGAELPGEFLAGRSVLVCTYQALFNGRSKFGVRSGGRSVTAAAAVLLDDAHVAFSTMRNAFTLRVEKEKAPEDYAHLTNTFRNDFQELGRLGTFDDIVNGRDYGVVEVPYWAWGARSAQVREYLRERAGSYPFEWPFLRDAFDYCHCLISQDAFVITPVLPLVDMIPTFSECRRRVFMSATIGDDSAIIRTFDADPDSIARPITSNSLAGVSERMILAPELMKFSIDDVPEMVQSVAKWMAEQRKLSTVVLVPSGTAAKKWKDAAAAVPDSPAQVTAWVKELQEGKTHGPVVFANRYDGIDLPGAACRVLVVSGLPRGMNEYDAYRSTTFMGSSELTSTLAQRIEQGMGRGARGGGDYCVVILTGKDLIAWIDRPANHRFLTSSTRAQLKIGADVGAEIATKKELALTMLRCLGRDRDWVEYHAETLAELVRPETVDREQLAHAAAERGAFRLVRGNYYEKAINKLDKYCEETPTLDSKGRGWLRQMAARAAHYWGRDDVAQRLQQHAYADNDNLLRPRVVRDYVPLTPPGGQAEAIISGIDEFGARRGYVAQFDETVSHLVPEASSNQFEQALTDLGAMLGFSAERPDKNYGKGPDVLWLLSGHLALIIEAKSRKNRDNALTKDQHGQLLNAAEWFRSEYPGRTGVRVSMHPNVRATESTVPGDSKALTYEKLNALIAEARALIVSLCESVVSREELVMRCERLLGESSLTPDSLVKEYLVPFETSD
jgi:replicative superfamily II helicase